MGPEGEGGDENGMGWGEREMRERVERGIVWEERVRMVVRERGRQGEGHVGD